MYHFTNIKLMMFQLYFIRASPNKFFGLSFSIIDTENLTCKSATVDSYSSSSKKFFSEQRLSWRILEIDFVMRS